MIFFSVALRYFTSNSTCMLVEQIVCAGFVSIWTDQILLLFEEGDKNSPVVFISIGLGCQVVPGMIGTLGNYGNKPKWPALVQFKEKLTRGNNLNW